MMREGYPTIWEKMAQLRGRIAGRMCNIFGEIQSALREGQKMPPKRRHWLYGFTREVTEMFRFHKLDVQISQTRCLEFEHNTQGIIGAERLAY